MLDPHIATLARKTAAPQLTDRDHPLDVSAGTLKGKMHGHGHLYLYMMQLYVREMSARARG